MTDPSFDVESYRMIHESNTEWNLRKQFIMAHHDKFEKNRLLCLSSCFINIECYGCRYPYEVMKQVKELALDVEDIEDHRNAVKQKMEVQFVKAGSSHTKTSIQTSSKKIPPKKGPIMFVKASSQAENTQSQEISMTELSSSVQKIHDEVELSQNKKTEGLAASFLCLQKVVRTLLDKKSHNSFYDLIVEACTKAKMKNEHSQVAPQDNLFCCELYINHVFVTNGKNTSKKSAMHKAYENAVTVLSSGSNPKIICKESDKKELIMLQSDVQKSLGSRKIDTNPSTSAPEKLNVIKRKRSYDDSNLIQGLENFIIMEPVFENSTATAVSVLGNSACINKFSIDYDFRQELEMVTCDLTLGGHLVASVAGTGRQAAKYQAAEKALSILKQTNWTIQTKQAVDSADGDVSKNEILGEQVESDVIPESNIGSQLLKKMGWSSGGLGKDGNKGISEPVSVSSVIHRQGLGLLQDHGVHKSFLPKIRQMILDYVKSDNQDDLAFAPDFSKEERNIIHQLARKFGLKSHSHGKEDNRFLVLSRKRSVQQLLLHIRSQGGETSKYKLVAPGESGDVGHT